MATFKIETNFKELERRLTDLQRRQIPFATATALNAIGVQALADVKDGIKKAFKNPTPFTLNAFYLKKARKSDLSAWLGTRDVASKGTPAAKYLAPEAFGGPRDMKRFERRLSEISGGQYVVPGRGAKLDAYGNLDRGQLGQILSRLGLLAAVGGNVSSRTTARLRRQKLLAHASHRGASDYFVAKSKSGRPLGVYQVIGRGRVVPVLLFTDRPPNYTVRFPFEQIVARSIARSSHGAFDRALAHALATAR